MNEDDIFNAFLKTPLPLATGTAPSESKAIRVAAHVNNPTGILVGKDKNGKPIYKEYGSPKEGVADTQTLVDTYLNNRGAMKSTKVTPENFVGMWVNGDPTTGATVQNGAYLNSLNKELKNSGIALNKDGTIPNSPEANAAITKALITHESGSNANKFLPHVGVSNNNENAIFNAFLKQPTVTIEELNLTETPTKPQDNIGNFSNFLEAAGHHAMMPLHGAANLIEQGGASLLNKIAPNSSIAKLAGNIAQQDINATRALEAQYQKNQPENLASFLGAVTGEVGPIMATGMGKAITKTGELGANLISRLGLGKTAQGVGNIGGQALASGGLSGLLGATQGTTSEKPYFKQVGQNVQNSALLGGAIPIAIPAIAGIGKYVENVAQSAIAPFTSGGTEKIAQNILNRFAQNKPINANSSEIIAGSKPTLAELSNNAGLSNLQRTIRDVNPTPFVEREQANALARLEAFGKIAKTPEELAALQNSRTLYADNEVNKILFANKGTVDSSPILETINGILKGPGGERTAVATTLNKIKGMIDKGVQEVPASKILDASGKPVSPASKVKKLQDDPEVLYQSVRKEIGDMLDKANLTDPAGRQAAKELLQVQSSIDDVIEKGASGFKTYLDTYHNNSTTIDSLKYLQGLKIFDQQGNITLSKVQNAIQAIGKGQKEAGIKAEKSINENQLKALQSIRDDLLRQSQIGLGRSLGSNTAQNLVTQNVMETLLPGGLGRLTGHLPTGSLTGAAGGGLGFALGGLPGAGVGMIAGSKIGNIGKSLVQNKNDAVIQALTEKMLNPTSLSIQPKKPTLSPQLIEKLYPGLIGSYDVLNR
jgi:hypothetical protein